MTAPFNALQAGIYTRLTGYSSLTTALGGSKVYDNVPQGTVAPYVVIGEDTSVDFDTKTGNGWEITLTLHCWDFLAKGRKSVKNLQSLIYDALHNQESNVTVTGFSLIMLRCEYNESFQDTTIDGGADNYYHGVMRFRAIISEV